MPLDRAEETLAIGRVHRLVFSVSDPPCPTLPLEGRKMHIQTDWGREAE